MGETNVEDFFAMDRDVKAAVSALLAWRAALAQDPPELEAPAPFEDVRWVAGKSTFDALGRLSPSAVDRAECAALRRWVAFLVQARIGLPFERAMAAARAAPAGHVEIDGVRRVSWREAWRKVAHAGSAAEARLWLQAAAEAAPALASVGARSATVRVEVAKRLGSEHPWELACPVPPPILRDVARLVLSATEDLAVALRRPSDGDKEDAASVWVAACARTAASGWPARLSSRWFREVFRGEPRTTEIALDGLGAAVGAASFVRGLGSFGRAVRFALIPSALPFSVAHDPAFVSAHRFGFVFESLGVDPEFHARALGLSRGAAREQARKLVPTAVLECRSIAARVLLADETDGAPEALFSEMTERLFGSPLDTRFVRAWPPAGGDEPARLLALLQAPSFRRDLRERFDADWFHNPRAWALLRELGRAPAHESIDAAALPGLAGDLAAELEEAAG